MLYWIRYPCIRITASFAAGILFNYYADISLIWLFILLPVCFIAYWIARGSLGKKLFLKYNLVISLLAFVCIFFMGSLCVHVRDPALNRRHLSQIPSDFDLYLIQVADVPDTTAKFCKVPGKIKLIHNKEGWLTSEGKVIVYLPLSATVHFGDKLLIRGMPQPIGPPLNPDGFDYQRFMRNKGILFQHFIPHEPFIILRNKPKFSIYGLSLRARQGITQLIEEQLTDDLTKGIMLALLTGQRQYIDTEIYEKFIRIGVVHTLAVSGLHVGIIYMFLLILFKPLHRYTWSKKIGMCIKILILLFFAFLTGLSPSVLRATLMFSTMIIGKILNRNSHVLNSVFLSAFLLLCIDPFLLFDVGFQLSYAAVTGIILYQPLIYGIIRSRFYLVDWLSRLTSVSISAQLGTLSFSLIYFNQFPVYFLLGNIIAIPYVTICIIAGIMLLILVPIKIFTWIIVYVLEFLSGIFLKSLSFLQSLPYGTIHPLHLYTSQAILLVAVILSLYLMISFKSWKMALATSTCLGLMAGIDLFYWIGTNTDKQIIVYNVPGISCVELVDGHKGIMLIDDQAINHISRIDYYTQNHIVKHKRKTEINPYSRLSEKLAAFTSNGLLICTWNGKSIVLVHENSAIQQLKNIQVDYLILSNNIASPDILKELDPLPSHVIWDSSNRGFQNADIGRGPDNIDTGIRYSGHQVRKDGPYIDDID